MSTVIRGGQCHGIPSSRKKRQFWELPDLESSPRAILVIKAEPSLQSLWIFFITL